MLEQIQLRRNYFIVALALPSLYWVLAKWDFLLTTGMIWVGFYVGAYSYAHVPGYANYYFPLFAFIILLAARGVHLSSARLMSLAGRQKAWWASLGAASSVAVALLCVGSSFRHSTFRMFSWKSTMPEDFPYVQIGNYLREKTAPDASVGVMEIGLVGYVAQRRIVDFVGLASREVARQLSLGNTRYALTTYQPHYVVARYPSPARMEGDLSELELVGNYKMVFSSGGIGVFARTTYDRAENLKRLLNLSHSFIIPRHWIPDEELRWMNEQLEDRKDVRIARSLFHSNHDIGTFDYYYVTFREGRLDTLVKRVDRYDAATLSRPVVLDFRSPESSFEPLNTIEVRIDDSLLKVRTLTGDSYMGRAVGPLAPWFFGEVEFKARMSATDGCHPTGGWIFWTTEEDSRWGTGGKSAGFHPVADGRFHVYKIPLSGLPTWNGSGIIEQLRLDPMNCPGTAEFEYVRIQ